jgi:hypothetical protein
MRRCAIGMRDGLMKRLHWATRLELELAKPQSLRVLDKASVVRLARGVLSDLSIPTIDRWIREAIASGRLQRVVRGTYLNRFIHPAAQPCEAAVWLRQGATISLQTVLGDSGVWNSFTDWVTAVVPLSPRFSLPSLGRMSTGAGTFVFRGIPLRTLDVGAESDRLEAGLSYRRATPEAALLHWLYLARSPRSHLSAPPADLDVASLDSRRLVRLARAMGLMGALNEWAMNAHGRPFHPHTKAVLS